MVGLLSTLARKPLEVGIHPETAICIADFAPVTEANLARMGQTTRLISRLPANKDQHGIERDFGFLKDPAIVNAISHKRLEPIEALGFSSWSRCYCGGSSRLRRAASCPSPGRPSSDGTTGPGVPG